MINVSKSNLKIRPDSHRDENLKMVKFIEVAAWVERLVGLIEDTNFTSP
jgi:hypothetical protein